MVLRRIDQLRQVSFCSWRLQPVLRRPVLMLRRFDRRRAERVPFMSAMTALTASDGDRRSYLEIVEVLRETRMDRELRVYVDVHGEPVAAGRLWTRGRAGAARGERTRCGNRSSSSVWPTRSAEGSTRSPMRSAIPRTKSTVA